MSSVYKKKYTIPPPKSAERFKRGSAEWARWKDRAGRRREGRVTTGKDGAERVLVEATTYTAKYRDAAGVVCVVSTGCKDRSTALAVAAELDKRAEKVRAGVITAAENIAANNAQAKTESCIAAYVEHLEHIGCCRKHIVERRRTLTRVARECGFNRLRDLSGEPLEKWLGVCAREGMGPRTRNTYRAALNAFANWLVMTKRITANPFKHVSAANERTDVRRQRRAFSVDELLRLFEAARRRPLEEALKIRRGSRRGTCAANIRPEVRERLVELGQTRALAYKTMALTGLRLGELRSIRLSQVRLDHQPPYIELEAAHEKARRGARVALQQDLAAELSAYIASRIGRANLRPSSANVVAFGATAQDPLLFELPPAMTRIFTLDLQAAKIIKVDERGRVVDVHSLRHTFGTLLAKSGVPQQLAQFAMRHSDPKLTANLYTHLDLGDLGTAVAAIPPLVARERAAATAESASVSLAPTLAPTPVSSRQEQATSGKSISDMGLYSASKQAVRIGNKDKGIHHAATAGNEKQLERDTRFELATSSLGSWRSAN